MKFLDAYSSITNISPLYFWLPTSSTSPKKYCSNSAGRLPFSLLYCCIQILAGCFGVFHGQVLSHPMWIRANGSLQFPSLTQSSRTCKRGTLSLAERDCRDPGCFFFFFLRASNFSLISRGKKHHSAALLLIPSLSLLAQLIQHNLLWDDRFYAATFTFV